MQQDNFESQKISSSFRVVLTSSPYEDDMPKDVVDAIFQRLQTEKPFFDGTLICVKDFSEDFIEAYPISFKEFITSNHLPKYKDRHSPLAVSGWILHQQKVLIGMRSNNVWSHPNFFEFVPSGGIDHTAIEKTSVNYKHALMKEFEEETGLDKELIERITPHYLVYSQEKQLFDICQSIEISSDALVECDLSNEEYDHLFWLPLKDLDAFVTKHADQFIPTSLAILNTKVLT